MKPVLLMTAVAMLELGRGCIREEMNLEPPVVLIDQAPRGFIQL